MSNRRRVVITGMGTVNPLANNIDETWKKMLNGESGLATVTGFNLDGLRATTAAQIKNFDLSKTGIDGKIIQKMEMFQQLAFACLFEAALMAKIPVKSPEEDGKILPEFENIKKAIDDPFRLGVMLGSGIGGIRTIEEQVEVLLTKGARRVSAFLIPKIIINLAAGWIGQGIGAMGPNLSFVTACASGTNAIGEAMLAIINDRADIIVSGGIEMGISKIAYAGFGNMHALSTINDTPESACRPFSKDRSGFVMGDGGAIIVLEELEHAKKRNIPILAELVGYGTTADAYHITAPHPEGIGAVRAIQDAIKMANITPNMIDYINAHGTSTHANDRMETLAIKQVFGDYAKKIPISSTKSMTGHLLGGAGGIEAFVIIKTCMENKIPPTINIYNPDEELDLDYVPNTMREKVVNYAMSNSFGFGGHNAVIIIKKFVD